PRRHRRAGAGTGGGSAGEADQAGPASPAVLRTASTTHGRPGGAGRAADGWPFERLADQVGGWAGDRAAAEPLFELELIAAVSPADS
ncbi:MAG: hypothetical protein M3Z25_23995, partial [Actinomycetota bacterium]|nr:hypothetical protein [Actinomycetota bacterium]